MTPIDDGGATGLAEVAAALRDWAARNPAATAVLARVTTVRGISARWPGAAWATDGTDVAGSLLAGAADARLAGLAAQVRTSGSGVLATVTVEDDAAARAGLSCGGSAEVLLQPADQIPAPAWDRLVAARPVVLASRLTGPDLGATRTLPPHSAPAPGVHDLDGAPHLVTVHRPASRLVVVGDGLLADALAGFAVLLGWRPEVHTDPATSLAAAATLGPADGLVVLTHDGALDVGPMAAALTGGAGYVGAIGSRHTQAARRERLAAAGVDPAHVERLHGPAGLRIGSSTPAEIALAITAEMLATVRT